MKQINFSSCAGLLAVLLMSPLSAIQAAESTSTVFQSLTEAATQNKLQRSTFAAQWGLTAKEVDRYEVIMQGRRGVWSPNIDPVMALGLEARTDEERARFAELLALQEQQRAEQELALQRAYDAAWKKLNPSGVLIAPSFSEQIASINAKTKRTTLGQSNRRLTVVTSLDCASCDVVIKNMISKQSAMDIYFTDAKKDDGLVRAWAKKIRLPVEMVSKKQVTLNHITQKVKENPKFKANSLPSIWAR